MVQSTEASRLDAVNCVLWDLDGTLTDSIADICASLNVVLEQSGLSAVSVDEARTMVGLGAGKLLQRAFTHVGGEAQYNAEPAYASFIEHYRDNCCVHTTLFNGVRDVLDTLHQRGFQQGVCTNKPEQMASKIIADLGLGDYFGVVVGGDSTSRRKPDAEPVQACLNALQIPAHSAVMIGDSPADAGCAIAAGIPVILVDWGYTDAALDELGAERVLSDIAVLPGLLPEQA